jgi:hypothetical protein
MNSKVIVGSFQKDVKNNDFGSSINIPNSWLSKMFSFEYGRKHRDEVYSANVNVKGTEHSGVLGVEKRFV